MDKLTIISRIKALLSLGDSSRNPYEEEVKTALKMAQDLMKKYNLTLSEIDLKNSPDTDIDKTQTDYEGHLEPWKRHLARVIKILYDVEPIIDGVAYHKNSYLFVGFKVDCECAKITYDYLINLIDFKSKLKYKGQRLQRYAYLQGFLSCLEERATKEKELIDSLNKSTENIKYGALVIIKHDRIRDWLSKNLKTHNVHNRSELNLEDLIEYQKGYCDANKIKLNNKKEIK